MGKTSMGTHQGVSQIAVDNTLDTRGRGLASRLLIGGSCLAVTMAAFAAPAFAQVSSPEPISDEVDEVVATGIRSSLENAQDLKRASDVFVDAITAEDIGALPDRSVSEALQRVPGVSVLRFAGPNDPDHFSVEGSGVIIRGLEFTRSELNGRDVFGASDGGRLGFEDVSPELLGSVAVFKNQSADMVEGGLSGTIDLRTRLPFDSAEDVFAFTLDGTYSDFAEEITPSGSILASKSWDTNEGTFGLLLSGSANRLKSRADGFAITDFRERNDVVNGQTVFLPVGGSIRTQEFDRERDALAGAFQWESNDGRKELTAQFLHSDSGLTWGENVVETAADGVGQGALAGTDFEFDSNGILTRGIVTENVGWRGNDTGLPLNGTQQTFNTRERDERDQTTDYGLNFKYAPKDNLRFNFDAQYVDAETRVRDVSVFNSAFAQVGIDTRGDNPGIAFFAPIGTGPDYFSDPQNTFVRAMMDHAQDNEAESLAFRADVEYDISDSGFLRSTRFGARYADRDTTLRYTTFNWGNVSEIWTGNPNGLLRANDPSVGAFVSPFTFENHFRSGNAALSNVPFWNGPLAEDYDDFLRVSEDILGQQGSFRQSLRQRAGTGGPDGLYLPSEIAVNQEESVAFYGRLDFGVDNIGGSNVSLDGNIGVRYVETDVTNNGSQFIPNAADALGLAGGAGTLQDRIAASCDPAQNQGGGPLPGFCSVDTNQLVAFFGEGGSVTQPISIENTYDNWLPSLNAKLDFGNGMLVRFGASRAISRPTVFQQRNFQTVELLEDVLDPATGQNLFQGLGTITGNPFLRPITSDQFDLSFEYYFNDVGSITVSGFYKTLDDFIIGSVGDPGRPITPGGSVQTQITNNGVTLPLQLQTAVNAQNTDASLKGVEVAYQQFYDFLPGALAGFGIQANYTYIDADGIADINPTATGRFSSANNDFERVSEHQFNVAGLYELDRIQARLAYNWRSDFLLTREDVIFPFTSIYQEATGQLDGSIFYDLTDNFKIGVQGVNLLDDITETTQVVNDAGLRAARAFNRNDRRFSFILRANF